MVDPIPQTPQIDSAAAVRLAYEYLLKVTGGDATRYSNFRVEEVQRDNGAFLVTLSYDATGEFPFEKKREYKDFRIEGDRSVAWMKIRKVS